MSSTKRQARQAARLVVADDPDDEVSRAEFAYSQLIEMIRDGELRPGHRVKEMDIASLLNVSRTPIREAIRRLMSEGLVARSSSRGMMITQLDKQQVRELYALRGTLESAAARLAAQHASPAEIEVMKELLALSKQSKSPEDSSRSNRLFHQAIADSAHNRYLTRALSQLSMSLALLPGTTFEVPGRNDTAYVEHKAIVTAIDKRDPDAAERAARSHIEQAALTRIRMMFAAA